MNETTQTPSPKFFCFYKSYGALLECLTDAQAGRLIKSMYRKFFEDKEMEIKGKEAAGLVLISYQLETDKKRYQNVCERNRKNSQARRKRKEPRGSQSEDLDNQTQ